jgi:hypothetical protein
MPQFAVMRSRPVVNKAEGASLASADCAKTGCRHSGRYGQRFVYQMPAGTWGSYSLQPPRFSVSKAAYLEAWVKGVKGGERFEFVLWSYCSQGFPGRPSSAVITTTRSWKRVRVPLVDFVSPNVKLSSLCRLSIGFNDALSPAGTVFLDEIAFVDSAGKRIHIALDETTNVSNVGLYIADVIGALEVGLETYSSAKAKLSRTLTSLERLEKSHGFPHTHNHVVSLRTAMIKEKDDRCREDLPVCRRRSPASFPRWIWGIWRRD